MPQMGTKWGVLNNRNDRVKKMKLFVKRGHFEKAVKP